MVGCQTERSQLQNKETALKMLKSKLLEIKEREQLEKIDDIKGVKTNIEWVSRQTFIRFACRIHLRRMVPHRI